MDSVLLPFLFVEVFVVIYLRIYVHDDQHCLCGLIIQANGDDVLSVDVVHVLNNLWFVAELVGPNYLLFISLDILQNQVATAKVKDS